VSPLGAGALAGSSLPLDPDGVADDLGFAAASRTASTPCPTATSWPRRCSRSRWSACTSRAWARSWCCGRRRVRLRPARRRLRHRQLDDAAEEEPRHRRAGAWQGRSSIGDLTGLLATLKGLPLAYNRDLQEDKEPLFDAVDQVALGLSAMTGLLASIQFDTEAMQAAADTPYVAATDLAEQLVLRGTPFREAHAIVGQLVRESLDGDVALGDLVAAHPAFEDSDRTLLDPGVAVARRSSPGGGGPVALVPQLERFQGPVGRRSGAHRWLSPYVHHVHVRYGECDMQRVVFNAHYLAYCDHAPTSGSGRWVPASRPAPGMSW
jgi:argininosuccinate lyase